MSKGFQEIQLQDIAQPASQWEAPLTSPLLTGQLMVNLLLDKALVT